MRGTSTKAEVAAAAVSGTLSNQYRDGKYYVSHCVYSGGDFTGLTGMTLQGCCDRCLAQSFGSEIEAVHNKDDGTECGCVDKDMHNHCVQGGGKFHDSGEGYGFTAADCTSSSGRKKRSPQAPEKENIPLNTTLTYIPTPRTSNFLYKLKNGEEKLVVEASSGAPRRKRQSGQDLVTMRNLKCESLWGGEGGYWLYTHEVPEYCFSKFISSYNC